MATNPKKNPPKKLILVTMLLMKSAVGLPGLIPATNPPLR